MKLRKCVGCDLYTFKMKCSKCNGETSNPHPPRYSPEDKYGHLRRKFIEEFKIS
ncbi:MAG: nucleolar RNA-binding Nop10p family protein [Candidatus Aenigmarchaeota archaeon]|nr:nucleolar RNA-binding Nop10p family protein [Candidatus Aenigmarchaeota archaeon]